MGEPAYPIIELRGPESNLAFGTDAGPRNLSLQDQKYGRECHSHLYPAEYSRVASIDDRFDNRDSSSGARLK